MNERICIIGGGHSSGKLIKNLLDNNYKGEISIFSEEKYSPYERPPLSKEYLKDEVEIKDFQINFDSKRKNINLFLNSKIDKINLETKIISDINDKKHKYDKIVFANGSKPKKINNNLEGICYLRNINDSEFIKKRLHDSEDIAILGAGYIGLEVASSIIEKFPQKKNNNN
jgi:NADPH-dependent 2,4-dienoyl-CoA reductase/sulfur reductase-like enzyme